MSTHLFRRMTMSKEEGRHPQMRTESGESAQKAVKSLLKTLEAYMASKTPEKLAEIGTKVAVVWNSVFEIARDTAPQKKYELAEEILLRPDVLKHLLFVFRHVHLDVKRKIRDIYKFVVVWCSNDSADSCVPRSRAKTKFSPKVRDQLWHCREEIVDIVAEGYDEPASVGFYNDVIREFVRDDVCLMALLDDDGKDSTGFAVRPYGCVWSVFEKLTLMDRNTYFDAFDVTVATFETIQIILGSNHDAVHAFFDRNFARFLQSVQKLISSANYYVQAKSLQLLYQVFTTQRHYEVRARWMADPSFIRVVVLALQSNKKSVRTEALTLFELFVENPRNAPPIDEFIARNCNTLIAYCFDSAPIHYYRGDRSEMEDARFAKIAYKLLNWNLERPFTREQAIEFEYGEKLQQKMYEEQTVKTLFQDFAEGVPITRHDFSPKVPGYPAPLRM